jgi:hypothetical protein
MGLRIWGNTSAHFFLCDVEEIACCGNHEKINACEEFYVYGWDDGFVYYAAL